MPLRRGIQNTFNDYCVGVDITPPRLPEMVPKSTDAGETVRYVEFNTNPVTGKPLPKPKIKDSEEPTFLLRKAMGVLKKKVVA